MYSSIIKNWSFLEEEFKKQYFKNIISFIEKERLTKTIFPKSKNIFKALELTNFENTKVIILGQDPYHTELAAPHVGLGFGLFEFNDANLYNNVLNEAEGVATGLSFAVENNVKTPPSLKNIIKELTNSYGENAANIDTNLESWAKQGVLMLNTVLTVEKGNPNSHQNIGWDQFTKKIIKELAKSKNNLVFILWGAFAQSFVDDIDESRHLVLKSPHPSPFSAHKGFLGNNHFILTNEYLKKTKQSPINWLG